MTPCPPCVDSKRLRVYRQQVHMLKHMYAWCRHTWGRFECTHGGVFESTHWFFHIFQRAATHKHTHQTHTTTTNNTTTTQRHTPHNTHHATSHGDREKEREIQRETERDRKRQRETEKRETRQDKTREEKMTEERREKKKEKKREDEREEKRRAEQSRGRINSELFFGYTVSFATVRALYRVIPPRPLVARPRSAQVRASCPFLVRAPWETLARRACGVGTGGFFPLSGRALNTISCRSCCATSSVKTGSTSST